MIPETTAGLSGRKLHVGEAAVRKLNALDLHAGFETALGHAMDAWQQQSGCANGAAVVNAHAIYRCL